MATWDKAPGKLKFVIRKGKTFNPVITLDAIDLAGAVVRMQARASVNAADVLLEMTTVNGKITLDVAAKAIKPFLSATETAALTFGAAVYDMEIEYPNGTVDPLLEGDIQVRDEVTR